MSLDGAPLAACAVPVLADRAGNLGLTRWPSDDVLEVSAGTQQFTLRKRTPGTEFLIASAQSGGRQSWTNTLPFIKAAGGLALVATPSMLVVYGAETAKGDDYGVVIGLDRETGAQRYAVPQDSDFSGNVRSIHFNGQYVLIDWGFGLHAYDPRDGHRVWHIGGR